MTRRRRPPRTAHARPHRPDEADPAHPSPVRGPALAPFFVGLALLLLAACRGPGDAPEATPPSDRQLTAEQMRKLIEQGSLRPVTAIENDTAFRDPKPDESDAFDDAAKRIAEQRTAQDAEAAKGDATKPGAAKPDGTEPKPPASTTAAPVGAQPASTAPASAASSTAPASGAHATEAATPAAKPASDDPPENPYLVFGKRIVVYPNGLIMKPYPLRVGSGKGMSELLKKYGNFPLYTEGQQSPDQVRLDLQEKWDMEQFADLRQTVVGDEQTKVATIADWLVVTTGVERLKEVESFINIFAAGVPQIEIEAKIVEVTTTDTLDLGVKPIDATTPIFGFPDHTFVQSFTYSLPNTAGVANSLLALSAVQDGVTFNALLQMLQTYDNVSIISRPKIAVREGGIARIVNTNKLPSYSVSAVQANGQASATLTYDEVGIKLFVVPRVVGTQTVALNIDVEASQQSGNAATFTLGNGQVISNPIISRRAAQTVVYLEPGQAVILGGLVSERTVDTENKVPILGSIPVLGYLFRSTFKRKEQANVLFFIRPRILSGSDLNRDF